MRILAKIIAGPFLLVAIIAHAQNWATVAASNITDLNQNKLAAGQLCFLVTDQNDNPISVNVGGGGQTLKRAFCSPVAAGAVTAFTVPNPAATSPSGIYYRVTVKDTSTGLEVLRYTQVTFSGGSFNFDNYAPSNVGSPAPLNNTVNGNLTVNGNASVTGTLAAGATTIAGTVSASGGMKNTSLVGSSNGNNVTLLNQQASGTHLTGNSSDQAIFTYTLPANTLGPGKCLNVKAVWFHDTGTATATYKIIIGSTSFGANTSSGVDNTQNEEYVLELCNNPGVQNAQNGVLSRKFRSANVTSVLVNEIIEIHLPASSIDFTSAQTISVTFNVASTDKVTPQYFKVWIDQ